jgi:NACalpha-BTF3-like transcription factor
MSSTDTSKMKKTRATSNQPSKQPVKSYPSTAPAKRTPTADQMRLQQLISDSEYNHSAEVKGKVTKVMDVTGMNEDDVVDALETCNYDEEQAITRLVEAGPTGGQWKTTGKKKKGKGGEKHVQTDKDIDAIAAPGFLRVNGYDKDVEMREGTSRAG